VTQLQLNKSSLVSACSHIQLHRGMVDLRKRTMESGLFNTTFSSETFPAQISSR
jgi:hypothetical protein